MKGRNLIGVLCTGALAHSQGGLHIQRALHPAVQHGTACFTGGGKVGARHAAPQGDDGRAQDLYRAFHAELNGLAAVGQQVAVLVDGPQADRRAVPGGAVGQDGVVHHAFQPDRLHRLLDHGADGAPVPDCLEPVDAGRPAQHADVFVVHPEQVVCAQPQGEHPRPGERRKVQRVPAHLVEDGRHLRGRALVKALILFQ